MASSARRISFRYSLRTLFLVTAVVGIWLGWNVNVVRQRRAALAAFEREEWGLEVTTAPELSWIRRLLGDEPVGAIHFTLPPASDLTWARECFPEATLYRGLKCPEEVPKSEESERLKADPETRRILEGG